MSEIKGDFIGFTFNGVHSSELGLIRVSDGNRYTENLLPALQEKTVQVPGADGTYYFGTYFTQRQIDISVSFDDMSEEQFQRLKVLLGDKKIHDLIFDEAPYKVYRVKATGTPNLKYVCFDKGRNEFERDYNEGWRVSSKDELYGVGAKKKFGRVYKGEGQLNFMAYAPYARSRFKYKNEYKYPFIPEWGSLYSSAAVNVNNNAADWMEEVGFKNSDTIFQRNPVGNNDPQRISSYKIDVVYGGEKNDENPSELGIYVYNPGVAPTNFILNVLPIPKPASYIIGEPISDPEEEGFYIKKESGEYVLTKDNYIVPTKTYYKKTGLFDCDFILEDPDKHFLTDQHPDKHLFIKDLFLQPEDDGFRINTALNLLEGIRKVDDNNNIYEVTGSLYNKFIKAGDFFKIPNSREEQFIGFRGPWHKADPDPSINPPEVSHYDQPSTFVGSIIYNYLFY